MPISRRSWSRQLSGACFIPPLSTLTDLRNTQLAIAWHLPWWGQPDVDKHCSATVGYCSPWVTFTASLLLSNSLTAQWRSLSEQPAIPSISDPCWSLLTVHPWRVQVKYFPKGPILQQVTHCSVIGYIGLFNLLVIRINSFLCVYIHEGPYYMLMVVSVMITSMMMMMNPWLYYLPWWGQGKLLGWPEDSFSHYPHRSVCVGSHPISHRQDRCLPERLVTGQSPLISHGGPRVMMWRVRGQGAGSPVTQKDMKGFFVCLFVCHIISQWFP